VEKPSEPQHLQCSGRLKNGNPAGNPAAAARCGARTRAGLPCRCPAIRGRKRCKLHGGRSTGPKTAAGRERIRQANFKHGRYSAQVIALQREARSALRAMRELMKSPTLR
jgi:hypothetical protein